MNTSVLIRQVFKHINTALVQKKALNHEFAQHIGVSRGGNTTKIHTVVNALGNPLLFQLTGGPVYNSQPALGLLANISLEGSHVLGDKAYRLQEIRDYLTSQGASYVIPPRVNAKKTWSVDWYLYKERHLVECFFNKIKHFRRVATRYDKLATSFLVFIYMAATFKLTQ